jgi:hypothetical protein
MTAERTPSSSFARRWRTLICLSLINYDHARFHLRSDNTCCIKGWVQAETKAPINDLVEDIIENFGRRTSSS